MQDVNHALTILGEKLRIKDLKLNGNNQAEVRFGDGLSVYVTQMEPGIAEMSFRLPDLDFADAGMMRAMLEANCLGQGTGTGRLAIDAGDGGAIYCERWDVTAMDAASVETRFLDLARYGTFWLTEGTDALRAQASGMADDQRGNAGQPAATAGDEAMLFRV